MFCHMVLYGKFVANSIAVPQLLFDLHLKKNIQPSFVFPPLHDDLYRLLITTSIDHWVPRMLFAVPCPELF